MMCRAIILLAVLNLLSHTHVFAAEENTLRQKIIGTAFKGLAKTFVATNDIKKIKEQNISKIKKMSEEKFNKQRDKAYATLKELPPSIKSKYKVNENMTREDIIDNINSLDKNKINETIDAIPDSFITAQFDQYMEKTKQNVMQSNLVEQIKENWDNMVKKVQGN